MSRRIGEPWLARTPQSSFAVSAWASKWTMPMLPGRRTSATAVALGPVIEWSPPRTLGGARQGDRVSPPSPDRDRARRRALADLPVDQAVGPLDPRRDDVRVAGVHD